MSSAPSGEMDGQVIDETDVARLVAFIDNQLDEAEQQAVKTRLGTDARLRALYDQLQADGIPLSSVFAAVLAEAPLARMQGRLDTLERTAARLQPRRPWTSVAAAFALFLVGWGAGHYVSAPALLVPTSKEGEGWRDEVAEYVSLYTNETFTSQMPLNGAAALARFSQSLGVNLTPASIALPDLTFKWVNMLSYDGAPLGQIAYLDESGNPVVFCVIRNGQKDAPVTKENREGVAIASWARSGRGFLVGGRISSERAGKLAGILAARF